MPTPLLEQPSLHVEPAGENGLLLTVETAERTIELGDYDRKHLRSLEGLLRDCSAGWAGLYDTFTGMPADCINEVAGGDLRGIGRSCIKTVAMAVGFWRGGAAVGRLLNGPDAAATMAEEETAPAAPTSGSGSGRPAVRRHSRSGRSGHSSPG